MIDLDTAIALDDRIEKLEAELAKARAHIQEQAEIITVLNLSRKWYKEEIKALELELMEARDVY